MGTNLQEILQYKIDNAFKIYNQYNWLINAYVLDFFTDQNWEKFNSSWRTQFGDLPAESIADILDCDMTTRKNVLPLTVLTLRALFLDYCVKRQPDRVFKSNADFMNDRSIAKIFWKNVKLKKRHEISIMAEICHQTARKSNCFYVVDVGSGLGHLSRFLCYGYDLKICAIEAQKKLSDSSKTLDREFETLISKKHLEFKKPHRTVHLNMTAESDLKAQDFEELLRTQFKISAEQEFSFGIIGLHPCGNLGTTLLRLYTECPNAKFINIVGCCYMKLSSFSSSPTPENKGFPISNFCISKQYELSYHSREIACHAIESYIDKLRGGEIWKLKIHAYRAAIEKLIVKSKPVLKHSSLANVKYEKGLTFDSYCKRALSKLDLILSDEDINSEDIGKCLQEWKKVVVFYSLRLLFAPLIESVILFDRWLYILEKGNFGELTPVFDPRISPRNNVLCAIKK